MYIALRVEPEILRFWWPKPRAPSEFSAGLPSARVLQPSSPMLGIGIEKGFAKVER